MTTDTVQADVVAKRMELLAGQAEYFMTALEATEPSIDLDSGELLVGPNHMNCKPSDAKDIPCPGDNYHYPSGMMNILKRGLTGIASTARQNAAKFDGERAQHLGVLADCYEATAPYCRKWAKCARDMAENAPSVYHRMRLITIADNCDALAEGPPATFHQAAQLVWFALAFRNNNLFSPLGRLDLYMGPFYHADLDAGRITPEMGQEIVDELFRKIDTIGLGDSLMNLMLGGVDVDGNDMTNDVTIMMIDASITQRITSPLVNIRVHSGTPDRLREKITELQLMGEGKGTLFNDEVIIPSMVEAGIPLELARNYACDGCNELLIDGQSVIEFNAMECAKSVELMLFNGKANPEADRKKLMAAYHYVGENVEVDAHTQEGFESGDFTTMQTFDEVFEAFMSQYLHHVGEGLDWLNRNAQENNVNGITSPFLAGSFAPCIETGLDPLRGGAEYRMFMIFSGSITTAADALAGIKKVIFEDKACTQQELLDALTVDWEGHDALRERFLAAPKFGNDDDYVDQIAAEIARRFSAFVRSFDHNLPAPIHPALFCHVFNVWSVTTGALPCGRKRGEPIGEHFSPVPGRAVNGPTAVINSMCKAPLNEMVGTAVTHVSLSRSALGTDAEAGTLLRTLVDTGLDMGLICVNFPVYSVDQMLDAQAHPERHKDLIVRVWGFSERFINLDKRLQDHLIARAVKE
jgi:pyruvate-formate lyase